MEKKIYLRQPGLGSNSRVTKQIVYICDVAALPLPLLQIIIIIAHEGYSFVLFYFI